MPNQRAPGTVMLSIPMPEALRKDLKKLARDNSQTLTDYVRVSLRKLARRSLAAKKEGK